MASDSLDNLRTKVREEADVVEETERHPNAAIDRRINTALKDLYRKLQIANPHELVHKSSSLTTTSGQDTVALPSDFQRLISATATVSGESWLLEREHLPLLKAMVDDDLGSGWEVGTLVRYAVLGPDAFTNPTGAGKLLLHPVPQGAHTVKVTYNPTVTALSATSDTFEDFGFEEYVVIAAAISTLRQDGLDIQDHEARRQQLEADVVRFAHTRDLSGTRGPADVRSRRRRGFRDRWNDVV